MAGPCGMFSVRLPENWSAPVSAILNSIPDMVRYSRIPGIPGIRTLQHSVSAPGIEQVGTVWCPYVLLLHMTTKKARDAS